MRFRRAQWIRLLTLVSGFLLLMNLGIALGETSYPEPKGAVNDFAGIIPAEYQSRMAALAHEVLQKTGTSVVVATVETVGDLDPFTYANGLYEAWGIGKKGEDKGVLIFLAVKERKLRIETGYGVEGILPDGLVGQIMDDYMLPYLRKNEFEKGLLSGMIALGNIIAKDAGVKLDGIVPLKRPVSKRRNSALGFLPILFFIILFLALSRSRTGIMPLLLLMMMGRGGGFGGSLGGGFGGFGGGFGGFGGGLSGGGGGGRSF